MARQRGALLDAGVFALAVVDAWLRAATEGSGLVVSLVAALALILRRRGPLLAFVFTLPALFTIGLLVAPFVALYTVAERSRPRGAVLSCAVVAGVGDFLPWPPTHFHLDEVLSHGLDLIDSVVYVGASVALGVLVRTRRELSARLAELTAARENDRGSWSPGLCWPGNAPGWPARCTTLCPTRSASSPSKPARFGSRRAT